MVQTMEEAQSVPFDVSDCVLEASLSSDKCRHLVFVREKMCGDSSTVAGHYRNSIYTCETWSVRR